MRDRNYGSLKPRFCSQSLMGTPLFTGDVFQWARFCNAIIPNAALEITVGH